MYKSAKHLDRKHTVFGRVVGGLDTLKAMEAVPTDEGDKPLVRSHPPVTALLTMLTPADTYCDPKRQRVRRPFQRGGREEG